MKKRKGSLLQRMMAVLLSAVLVTGMVSNAAPVTVLAQADNIVFGEGWMLTSSGTLIIVSNDGVTNWKENGWIENRQKVTALELDSEVTAITDSAFSSCGLTEIEIPDTVTSIGASAFAACSSLTSVTLSDNLTSIGDSAFYGCEKLQQITIPKAVMDIGIRAFSKCFLLESITFSGDTPPTLGSDVFGVVNYRCGFVKNGTQGIHVPEGRAQTYKDAWTDWAAYIADDTQTPPAEEHKHNDVTFTAWTQTNSLPDTAGNYYLTENVTLSATWNVPSGETNLCLNGKTISASGTDYSVIEIPKSGTLNLYDCQNAGNITGGKIHGVLNNGTFCMYGGKISGNGRASHGGGVWSSGTFWMYGGEISGNSALYFGGGVYIGDGIFRMCGGKISGNTNDTGGGVYIKDGTFTVGGGAVISGNTYNGTENNVYLKDGQMIVLDSETPLSGSAKIGVTSQTAPTDGNPVNITGANGADYSSFFTSDNPDYEIVNGENNVVQLAVKASPDTQPPTGKIEIEDNSWTQFQDPIIYRLFFREAKQVTITAQDEGSGVDKIYYYISGEVLFRQEVEPLGADKWTEGSSFSIAPDKRCIIYVKITDKAGNITYLSSDGLVFDATPPVINGVTDGETYDAPQTVTVTDAMSGVKSVTVNGAEVTLTDNQFTLGTADGSQTVVATDQSGNTTTVTVTVKAQTQSYAVTVHNGTGTGIYRAGDTVTVTANAPASGKQFDKWEVNSGSVTLDDAMSSTTTFTMPKRDVEVTAVYKDIKEKHEHNGVTFTAWTETDSLPDTAGNYYLTENVTLSDTWNVPGGETTLCLNGKTITQTTTGEWTISIGSGSTCKLYDCKDGGKITGKQGVSVGGGTFEIYGGSISDIRSDYAAVYVHDQGTFHMSGGRISDNQNKNVGLNSNDIGGGVNVNKGTFYMSGGEISRNSKYGSLGDGVSVYAGVFYMSGGKISENKNGVNVSQLAAFHMSGGEVSGNTGAYGGGVRILGTMTAGGNIEITGNTGTNGEEKNLFIQSGVIRIDTSNPLADPANIGVTTGIAPTDASPVNITGENGADYSGHFHSDNADYEIVNGGNNVVQLAVKASPDTQPPTGKIEIEDNSWTGFLNVITFGLFFKEEKDVTITAEDTGSGVDKIYYYISDSGMTEKQVKALEADAWTEEHFFSIDPDRECVIYAKITDKAGNITYLSSDGLVFDATPPVINGVTDGETYDAPQTVTVTDAMSGVKSVTVNGAEVNLTDNQFTLGTADGSQTVVATDQAGNTTTVTVTVKAQTQSYAVTVHNGTGTGIYRAGDTVTITANAPASGKQFDRWQVGRGSVTLDDAMSSTTTFTMPKRDVEVTAVYKDIKEKHEHNGVTFTAWTETDSLPDTAGNYYLTENVTLSDTWNVPGGETTLCLNGKTVSASGDYYVIQILRSCTLNLYDCQNAGNITGGQQGGINNNTGTFYMYGGKISGNGGKKYYVGGVRNTGTFYMYGGEISGNTANNCLCSGVNTDGAFYMYGGKIINNNNNNSVVSREYGGGVAINGSGSFTVGGDAVISGNTFNEKENNVFLDSNDTITIDSNNPLSNSANIGVTTATEPMDGNPVNITGENGVDYSRHFHSDNADYEIVNGGNNVVQLAVKASPDTQPPTGKIEIEDNSWTGFLNAITFGLFFKEEKDVTITAEDTGSGVDKIYYYISDSGMTEKQVKALEADAWTEEHSFSIDPDRECVIYAKITDKAGNVTYLSSDGLVFDATPPVINGVMDGETCNTPQTVTVTDAMSGVKSVTVNGAEVTLTDNQFTLGTADGSQTIVATDQAGNTTTVTVTVQAQTQSYAVTVHNGTGTGIYRAGDTVTVTADAPASGKQFDRWQVGRGSVTLADSTSSTTTFTMPERDVEVEATYKDITEEHTHNYGDWQHDDTQHWKVCGCGEETGRGNHDYGDWVTDKAATATEAGTRHRECQTCGCRQTETIPATGGNPGSGAVTPEVNPGTNAPAANISTPAEELKDMLLTDDEKQQVQNGTNVKIVLEVQDAGSTVSASDRAAVSQALNGYTVGQYLNIDLYKLVGEDRTDITETAKKIRIIITVPDSLKNDDSSKTRTFAVLRVHDGRAELLNDLDGSVDTVTIETDRFSTYAIVYKDTADSGGENSGKPDSTKDDEPKTGDNTPLELHATLAMIAGFAYLLLYFTDWRRGMTEETKKELVSRLVGWAKRGGKLRKCLALAAVFVLLVYYHSIGKKTCAEWKEIYGE